MLKVAEPFTPTRTRSPEKIVISTGAGESFTYTSPMLVSEPNGSLSFACGAAWAQLRVGKSKSSAARICHGARAAKRFHICFVTARGVVVKITGIWPTDVRTRRADKHYVAPPGFLVDRGNTGVYGSMKAPRVRPTRRAFQLCAGPLDSRVFT